MAKKSISQGAWKDNYGVCSKYVKRGIMYKVTAFFNSLYQNNRILGTDGSSKNKLVQRYEVLWIHNIVVICTIVGSSRLLFLQAV